MNNRPPKLAPMTRDELYALLLDNASLVINGLIDGLTSIAEPKQWDSESIEHLLRGIEAPLRALGVPSIGNTEANQEDWEFWAKVLDVDPDGDDDEEEWQPWHGL